MKPCGDGFLAFIARRSEVRERLQERSAGILTGAAAHLGPDVRVIRSGPLTLALSGTTTCIERGAGVRLGHGRAASALDPALAYTDWRNGLEGGFAALDVDPVDHTLRVARDRFGAVPVYLWQDAHGLAISTRLACLRSLAGGPEPDPLALLESVRFRWLAGRRTLVRGITQLGPGEELVWRRGEDRPAVAPWHQLRFTADGSTELTEQVRALRERLTHAIHGLLAHARHPAILLSGGVDSSVVAALAREVRPDVRCYIGRVESSDGAEELRRARFVADLLDLPLEEVPIDKARFASDLRAQIQRFEEPPRNPNNLVLGQLYEAMHHDGVDHVLNGDGAEMLLGLDDSERVARFSAKTRRVRLMPRRVRRAAAARLRTSDRVLAWRLADVLDTPPRDYAAALDEIVYPPAVRRALRTWMHDAAGDLGGPAGVLFDGATEPEAFDDALHAYACATFLLSAQRRHEMLARAVGIDATTPFTHSAVLAFAEQLPRTFRYTTRSRPVLKTLCDTLVHPDVARWPKIGFSVPWGAWLDGPLLPLVQEAANGDVLPHVLPTGLAARRHATDSAEWRWTLLTLHLALTLP